jgi:methionine-rich copper-binding protein CopC
MKVAAAIVALGVLVTMPGIALGHAELVSSDPPAGGTLTRTPYTLTATFDDELTPDGSSIVVEDASGAQVARGTVSADDPHVQTAELPALPNGAYTVRWTAVSADDAAVERGSYSFNVGASIPSGTPATPTPPPSSDGTGSNDVLLAIGLAAIFIVVVIGFVVLRGRR